MKIEWEKVNRYWIDWKGNENVGGKFSLIS